MLAAAPEPKPTPTGTGDTLITEVRSNPPSDTGGNAPPPLHPPSSRGLRVHLPGHPGHIELASYVVVSVDVSLPPQQDTIHPASQVQRYAICVRNPSKDPTQVVRHVLFAEQPQPPLFVIHQHPLKFEIHLVDLPVPLGPGEQGWVRGELKPTPFPSTIWVLTPPVRPA